MTTDKISLGQITIYGLRDGLFSLDGGAMFGVVPKVLWEKIYPADQENRIRLGLNSLLIDTGKSLILVETGIGTHLNQKLMKYYSVELNPGLVSSIRKLGYSSEEIDFVINTHLHFDHCGGNTFRDKNGEFKPVYPNARYVIQKKEWDYAQNPSSREKSSYLNQNFLPLEKYGHLWLIEDETEITAGVQVVPAPGHTSSHQCIKIHSEGRVVFYLGDMVPTSGHVGLPYIMSYDIFPLDTLKNKERYFKQASEEDWIVAFNHDPEYFFGKIMKIKHKYLFQPL